ncbi:hypothetical protein BN940_04711 [Castellaniella defragrans 65Phen]|uniref:Uncharacterized protein n=1 Tax=Castellaniella defragrans (strain DSM 12143 / CCUG 39792 / 65Phen) TaxID=1437824 RepID=W8X278_CASD6|nr:hypothetical protein BN940_04711 [Castellaniella defragrans 65Phen]
MAGEIGGGHGRNADRGWNGEVRIIVQWGGGVRGRGVSVSDGSGTGTLCLLPRRQLRNAPGRPQSG